MILGMNSSTFTLLHLLLSVAGIGSGFAVVFGMLHNRHRHGWATVFILTSMLTALTGFLFPLVQLLPSHILGLLSLTVLTLAIFARTTFQLEGLWRATYVIAITSTLCFHCLAAVTQAFAKIPALRNAAPTGSEPLSLFVHAMVLVAFIVVTVLATRRFQVPPLGSI